MAKFIIGGMKRKARTRLLFSLAVIAMVFAEWGVLTYFWRGLPMWGIGVMAITGILGLVDGASGLWALMNERGADPVEPR